MVAVKITFLSFPNRYTVSLSKIVTGFATRLGRERKQKRGYAVNKDTCF